MGKAPLDNVAIKVDKSVDNGRSKWIGNLKRMHTVHKGYVNAVYVMFSHRRRAEHDRNQTEDIKL